MTDKATKGFVQFSGLLDQDKIKNQKTLFKI